MQRKQKAVDPLARYAKDSRISLFGKMLESSEQNLITAGKLLIELRRETPLIDSFLISKYPKLNTLVLNNLAACGENKLIPAYVWSFGTVALKVSNLPIADQRHIQTNGVVVVTGGSQEEPVSRSIPLHKLSLSQAAQAFHGNKLRSVSEQAAFRAKKAAAVASAPWSSIPKGILVSRACLIEWQTLQAMVQAHFKNLDPRHSLDQRPLAGLSRTATVARAVSV